MLEFALALPILMLLTVGLLDLGSYSLQKSAMLQGARAGAQYGILDYSDAAKVNTTAQNATGLTGVTANTTWFCECVVGHGGRVHDDLQRRRHDQALCHRQYCQVVRIRC